MGQVDGAEAQTAGRDVGRRARRRGAGGGHVARGVVFTLLGGALWGLSGTASKFLMSSYAVDPLWLACARQMGSCVLFMAASALTARPQLAGCLRSPRDLGRIALMGVTAVMLMQVAYLEAIDLTNSATATILQSLGMLLVLAYACLRARRAPRRREWCGVALALVGTFLLVTGGDPGRLSLPAAGVAWGLATALSNALLSILPGKLIAWWGNFVVNALQMLVSGTALSLYYQPWAHMPSLDAVGLAVLCAIVVLGTFGAYALYLQGVSDVGPLRAILLGTIEPVAATVASIAWLGTSFSGAEIAGFALVIAMIFLTA
ncbi:MAG: DMT family transporter [Coriobacteriales bacterium]|jgi:drug/metabolite transporter (DMT)-like permease